MVWVLSGRFHEPCLYVDLRTCYVLILSLDPDSVAYSVMCSCNLTLYFAQFIVLLGYLEVGHCYLELFVVLFKDVSIYIRPENITIHVYVSGASRVEFSEVCFMWFHQFAALARYSAPLKACPIAGRLSDRRLLIRLPTCARTLTNEQVLAEVLMCTSQMKV